MATFEKYHRVADGKIAKINHEKNKVYQNILLNLEIFLKKKI